MADTPEQQDDELFTPECQAWLTYLQDKSFPVRASSLKRLRSLLLNDRSTISELTQIIKHDPILALHVVYQAEQAHAAKGSHVTSVEHAVSSLGIDPLLAISRTLQPVKINPASVQQKQYLRSLADSYHAAYQAQQWLQQKNLPLIEESFLAALFHDIGRWALWLHAPLHMHKINVALQQENATVQAVEQAVLGCHIAQISMALSHTWGLSDLTLHAQNPDNDPAPSLLERLCLRATDEQRLREDQLREVNHLVQERYFPIKLSHHFARSIGLQQPTDTFNITEVIAAYLGWEYDPAAMFLHQNCAVAAQHYHVQGSLSPATEMLFIPSDISVPALLSERELKLLTDHYPDSANVGPYKAEAPEEPEPEPEPEPESSPTEETQLPNQLLQTERYQLIAEHFIKGHDEHTKPVHILQNLMQGLIQGLGLPRVVLNVVNTKQNTLKAAQAFGLEATDPLTTAEIDLQTPSLFQKLIEKPGLVWIQPDTRQKYSSLLLEPFSSQIPPTGCLLMSIFRASGAVAIIYADAHHQHLSDFHQERFKYLCSAATIALKRMDSSNN